MWLWNTFFYILWCGWQMVLFYFRNDGISIFLLFFFKSISQWINKEKKKTNFLFSWLRFFFCVSCLLLTQIPTLLCYWLLKKPILNKYTVSYMIYLVMSSWPATYHITQTQMGKCERTFYRNYWRFSNGYFGVVRFPSNGSFSIAKTEEHVSNSFESKQKHPIEKSNGSLVLTNKTNGWLWHIYPKTSILTWKRQSKFIWCFRFPTDRKAIYDAVYCPKPKP